MSDDIDNLAMQFGFAARERHDVSEDAIEWWAYTGDAKREELRKMARIATRQQAVAVGAIVGQAADIVACQCQCKPVTLDKALRALAPSDATAALKERDARVWNEAIEAVKAEFTDKPWSWSAQEIHQMADALKKGTDKEECPGCGYGVPCGHPNCPEKGTPDAL